MDTESFFGITLNEKEPLTQFEVTEMENDGNMAFQKVVVKQISLGLEAKDGEFNVVQVETRINENEMIKIPIAVLKAGETRVLKPDLNFPSSSVTFKLIQGKGPVHICGQHIEEKDFDEDNESESEDNEDDLINPQTNGK